MLININNFTMPKSLNRSNSRKKIVESVSEESFDSEESTNSEESFDSEESTNSEESFDSEESTISEESTVSEEFVNKKKSSSKLKTDNCRGVIPHSKRKQIFKNKKGLINNAFQYINDEYCLVEYGTSKKRLLVVRTSDKKVNISQLCIDAGKQLKHWKEIDKSKEYIAQVMKKLHMTNVSELMDEVRKCGSNPIIRGVYAHELLVPNITQWCSAEFAVEVSIVMNNYMVKVYDDDVKERFAEKDDTICELNKEMKKLTRQMKKQTKQNALLLNYARNTTTQNDLLHMDNIELKDMIGDISNDKVVKLNNSQDNEIFVVIRNNDKKPKYGYYVIRTTKRRMPLAISNHKEKHKYARKILTIDNPNVINLWKRVGKTYGSSSSKPKLSICGNNFNLMKGCTEHKMLELINKVHNERLQPE